MADPNLELLNFLLRLATNKDLLRAFLKDPKSVAQREKLSKAQVDALAQGDQLALNTLIGADLGEWVMSKFQGVPPPIIPPPGSKSTSSRRSKK